MAPTVVLITGANRGIGKGLFELYLAKPNHIVIAANRNPYHEASKALYDVPKGEGSRLIVTKIDSLGPTDPQDAVKELEGQGIHHIDILIANAGIAYAWPKVSDVKVEDMQKHTESNVYGVVRLFQAMLPLLKKSANPKWVSMGSSAAFMTNMIPQPNAAYGQTKAVLHWLTKRIHIEEPWLTAFPIDPGWVQTDIGDRGAKCLGYEGARYEEASISVAVSVTGMVKVIDAATRETHSGKLWVYDGRQEPW